MATLRLGGRSAPQRAARGGGGAGGRPRRSAGRMMPVAVPRVPVKTPGENLWQWADLWDCLVRTQVNF